MSKEVIIDKVVEGIPKKYKVVEFPIDPPNTVRRVLVEVDIEEGDIPEGGILLSESEAAGLIAKQGKPENLLIGDMVRLRNGDGKLTGSIKSKLRSGMFSVRWDNGNTEKHDAKELAKVY